MAADFSTITCTACRSVVIPLHLIIPILNSIDVIPGTACKCEHLCVTVMYVCWEYRYNLEKYTKSCNLVK